MKVNKDEQTNHLTSGSEADLKEVEEEGENTGIPQGALRQENEICMKQETHFRKQERKQIYA